MFRGALISEAELGLLRCIDNVVRLGHVRRIERDRIVLDEGSVPTGETVHVHCAASGLARPVLRPIFEPGRVTVQPSLRGLACYQFATLGVIEATVDSEDQKNQLCPPMHTGTPTPTTGQPSWRPFRTIGPALPTRARRWMKNTRLNPLSGIALHGDDPVVIEAGERIKRFGAAAASNLVRFLRAKYRLLVIVLLVLFVICRFV